MSTTYLQWKDDGSTMTWDHFYWDQVVATNSTMKNLKIGAGRDAASLLQLAESIITGATGNAALANPPVTLTALGTLKTAAATSLTEEVQARESYQTKLTGRRDAMRDLYTAVKRYATFAHAVFAGDKGQLQSLGLDVVEFSGLLGVLPAPANLRSSPGKLEGTVSLRWQSVRGRSIYKGECAENAEGPWTQVYEGNRASATCANLDSGKKYFFRVRAVGSAGPGTWSDITSARAS